MSDQQLPEALLKDYQARTFQLISDLRIRTREDAVDFVNNRGFVFFWPISGIKFPSLWVAVSGDRPVADAHDDPGHITWRWKDELLGSDEWDYAKVLRKKSTIISFLMLPYFYALSENYGSYDEDYLTLYEQGRMTLEAKLVYETLLEKGRMDTVELRRATHMTSQGSESRFNRALADLQSDFKIVPVAVTDSGSWRYAFAYDIVVRHYPWLLEKAALIRERTAHQRLISEYIHSVGAAQEQDIVKLFKWNLSIVQISLGELIQNQEVLKGFCIENRIGEWYVSRNIFG